MAFRASLRSLAAKMTEAERQEALRGANEKMREYHMKRPPIEVILKSRKAKEGNSFFQLSVGALLVTYT